ncbi:MAG: two-component system, OmpR family, response regulator AdeR [Candidatus Poribacteria bacterium]|nr:two-component system, OmpR family, response regulator AdeR [Candidatus Poribacteria bacterium]
MNVNSILIVDDEVSIRDLLTEILKVKVGKIVSVESGSQALKILSRDRFDIVLTDIKMPDMDGFQLLESIKKFIDPIVPVVVMTGYNSTYDRLEAKAKGAVEYIAKPFEQADIIACIDKVMLKSLSERYEIILKYITFANNLIAHSNDPNKDELAIIGKRLLKYIDTNSN